MNNKKIGIVFLIALFLITQVYAFELTTKDTIKDVCPSTTVLYTATISGQGNFNVNYGGSAAAFTTVVPQGFSLNNEVRTIYVYVTPKLNTPPGIYDLSLIVTSGEEKTLNYKVNVGNCNQVSITGDQSKELCACNSEVFEYDIINAGNYEETYTVEVTGNGKEFVTLSENKFKLKSKEAKKINAIYNAPCGSSGDYNFNLNIKSLTSNAAASFNSKTTVNSCYDFNLVPEKTFLDMCEHTIQTIPLSIENTADAENEFSLFVTGPAWANLEKDNIKLDSNENGIVNLILNPDYKVEGSYDIDLRIISRDGKVTKDQLIKANVRICNDVMVDIEKSEDKVCNSVSKEYNVKIKNSGEFDKEFKLETDKSWASLEEQSLSVKANEEKDVVLSANPTKDLIGMYDLKVKASALDSSKIYNEDSIKLSLIETSKCYVPSIESQGISLMPDTTAVIEVKVTNNGPEKANYILSLSGKSFNFVQLNPATLEVDPGKTELTYLYVAPQFNVDYGKYDAILSARVEGSDILDTEIITVEVVEQGGIGKKVEEGVIQKSFLQRFLDWLKRNLSPARVEEVEEEINLTEIIEEVEETNITENVTEEVEVVEEPEVIKENELDKIKIITENVNFTFKEEIHSIIIKEVQGNSIILEIRSNPQYFILDLNESEKVDLDQDGTYDLELTLEEVKNNKPTIKTSSINERTEEIKEEVKESKDYEGVIISFLVAYKFYIILGIIILIVLILILSYWKEIVDFFEEEDEVGYKRKRK